MLDFARNAEAREPLGITYLHDDAQRLASLADGQFDGVASFLALTDIPDLAAVLDEVRRVVRPGGWLAFAVPHPCFEAPHATWTTTEPGRLARTITGYFDEGFWRSTNAEGIRGKVGAYHRTLATYLNLLLTMGFRPDRVEEPHFSAPAVERVPSHGVLPTILLVRARRDGS